ncbi:MAG: hypothetical protein ABI281_02515 [Caldimonas sp.]
MSGARFGRFVGSTGRAVLVGGFTALVLAACATSGPAPTAVAAAGSAVEPRGEARPCPEGVAAASRCVAGRDSAGAYYWLVVPPAWNGTLVVHAHGGPELGAPRPARAGDDLKRWSVWSRAGYAYAGSGYRQGGVAVTSAAEDIERVRGIFITEFGVPKHTVLHGQSWGAGVAAKAAEKFSAPAGGGKGPYDAVLLTSGVLGGSESYNFRLDLRVVYEALCGNHPGPGEIAYPLWQGLPPGSTLTRAQLSARVDECTGAGRRAAERTPVQQARLDAIAKVVRIPERSVASHLAWATWHFQNIVYERLAGRNPFGNIGVRYRGSSDDDALNARVARYAADPAAQAVFAVDADLRGRIAVPVLTVHAVDDPTAFVELESFFHDRMVQGGSGARLVQTFTDDHEHSYLSDAQYVAAMAALLAWVERGDKPTPASVAAGCFSVPAAFDPARGCRFLPSYAPAPLTDRVPAR